MLFERRKGLPFVIGMARGVVVARQITFQHPRTGANHTCRLAGSSVFQWRRAVAILTRPKAYSTTNQSTPWGEIRTGRSML